MRRPGVSRGAQRLCSVVLASLTVLTGAVWADVALGDEPSLGQVQRRVFTDGARYLVVEALDDDLLHFEMAASGAPSPSQPIYTTPMVAKTNYAGPRYFVAQSRTVETAELRASVAANLCVTVHDKVRAKDLHTLCPRNLESAWKGMTIESPATRNVYGLGQYFAEENSDGDWLGRVWDPLQDGFGSRLRGFAGGANNFSMFPIMYALGDGRDGYAIFLDQVYKQMWSFRGTPWTVEMWGDQVRWYVMSGPDLPDLRRDYMELTGKPPVPPKRSFGLWVSEFGFLNWGEVKTELADLRAKKMPVDGFALDLQWFGGTFGDPDHSRMGSLTWDERAFPSPREEIKRFKDEQGINLMLIEEPYISDTLTEHRELASRGFMARACATCGPTFLDYNPWWGRGGMVDFTNRSGSDFWHDYRRAPLTEMGITDHWADLGEPEQYDPSSWYAGFPELGKHAHADVHNIYGFKWMESIARGYERLGRNERPFLLSRTGTSGIQRFGVGVWSGDIGSNWGNLRSQMQAQMHMSMSGVDYYGSDAGGFQRNTSVEGGERLYTQWFAASAALDVPLRPHAWNLDKQRGTSPSRRGDLVANRENLRLRYRLAPYYYSLAVQANRSGDPVFPPLVHYYQEDPAVRRLGSHKLIGRDLLVVLNAESGGVTRDVYLPAGDWIDFHTNEWLTSSGKTFAKYPLYPEGYYRLPLFARAGAIIPMMTVDDGTWNIRGRRSQGAARSELRLKIFAAETPSSFTLYEDDGESVAYRRGEVASTRIDQQLVGNTVRVTIHPTVGRYSGLPASRDHLVELVVRDRVAEGVEMNGMTLSICTEEGQIGEGFPPCYVNDGAVIRIVAGTMAIASSKELVVRLADASVPAPFGVFSCRDAQTSAGTSVFVVGNVAELGNWDPIKGLKMTPSAYPTWTIKVANLPASAAVEWKCVKRREDGTGTPTWQAGSNNSLITPSSGYAGESTGTFSSRGN